MELGKRTKRAEVAMLSHDDEIKLIEAWQKDRCFESRDRVIRAHSFLVNRLAMRRRSKVRGPGLSIGDLVAEGNIGLMIAIDRFELERKTRFSTYAQWWAEARMRDYIRQNSSTVRIARNRAEVKSVPQNGDGEISPLEMQRISASWYGAVVISADRSISVEDDGGETFLDRIADETTSAESVMTRQLESGRKELIARIVAEADLKPKELMVVTGRFSGDNDGLTLKETGATLGVTAERTRHIERAALEKLARAAKRLRLRAEDVLGEVC